MIGRLRLEHYYYGTFCLMDIELYPGYIGWSFYCVATVPTGSDVGSNNNTRLNDKRYIPIASSLTHVITYVV